MLLLALALVLVASTALAADFDLARKGDVTVLIHVADGVNVPKARVQLYLVGEASVADSNVHYTLAPDFAASGADISDLSRSGLADTLAAWLNGRGITPAAEGVTGTNGQVRFSAVPVGLYLVVQAGFDSAETMYFSEISPFLVQMPMTNDTRTGWTYTVEAQPKVNPLPTPTPKPTPKPTAPGDNLPQTGSISWPIPLMGIGGLVLFAIGWALVFVKRKNHA